MSELNPQPLPPRGRVTVHVPTKVLYDLEAMQRITASVLDRLGCQGCHSGRILEFQEIEQFVVNPETMDVHELHLRSY